MQSLKSIKHIRYLNIHISPRNIGGLICDNARALSFALGTAQVLYSAMNNV